MTMPNATAGLVSARPRLAGSASGLGGFIQLGGGAFLSGLAAQLLGPESGPLPLVLIMLVCSLLSMVTALYVVFVARSLARAEQAGLEHSH
jgi:DHA1 family bicyclomycin/chloramphenicol resistance-like MFS transporter